MEISPNKPHWPFRQGNYNRHRCVFLVDVVVENTFNQSIEEVAWELFNWHLFNYVEFKEVINEDPNCPERGTESPTEWEKQKARILSIAEKDFMQLQDGFWYWNPEKPQGAISDYILLVIAEELRKRNKPLKDAIDAYMEEHKDDYNIS